MELLEDILSEVIIQELSKNIPLKTLKRALRKANKTALYKKLVEEVFYVLIKTGKINLPSGYGTLVIKDSSGKEKKIFDKKTGLMVSKKVKSKRLVYRPGEVIKQFL
jgi:hypothetical protein